MNKDIIDELYEYVSVEDTEIGEVCQLLITLSQYKSYISPKFYNMLIKEIKEYLDNFKENAIIKEEEVITRERYKYIEWKNL